MPYLVAPAADFTNGILSTAANALIRPTESLTGLTNGTAYRAIRLSDASAAFTPTGGTTTPTPSPTGFTDDFNRANGALAGTNWTLLFGASDPYTISGNTMVTTNTTESGIAAPVQAGADTGAFVEADIRAIVDAGGISLMRDAGNYICLYARSSDGRLTVRGRSGNVLFGPTAGSAIATVGARLRLELTNGLNWRTLLNGTPDHSGVMGAAMTGVRGGFSCRSVIGATWDNFAHGAL